MNNHHRFLTNIVYTATWIKNLSTNALKPHGLSNQQFNILRILRGADDWVTMTVIKELMIEKSPNATRLADKLLNKELIKRRRSESDRRVVYLHITTKGLDLLQEIDSINGGMQPEFMERLTAEEAQLVSDLLDKFRG